MIKILENNKNDVILINDNVVYGYNHKKIIATYSVIDCNIIEFRINITTIQNEKFLIKFKEFVKKY